MRHALFTIACLWMSMLVATAPLGAADPAPEFGPSISYDAGDPVFRIADLRGKMAIVLLAQSWCPVCNGWSGEFLQRLQKAWADQPKVALVFIKTDGDAAGAKAYLSKQGANPDLWLVASDAGATWTKAALGQDKLWQCLVLDPGGRMVQEDTKAVNHWNDEAKTPLLVGSKPLPPALAAACVRLPAGPAATSSLGRARRLAEIGMYLEALAATRNGPRSEQDAFRAQVVAAAGSDVARLGASATAAAPGRYEAYGRLRRLANSLKGLPVGQTARTTLTAVEKTPEIQAEITVERAWAAVQQRAMAVPADRRSAALEAARGQFRAAHPNSEFAASL